MIKFFCYGDPVAQGRPRAFRMGNHIRMYDPKNSKNWKETVKWQVIEQKPQVMQGALSMTLNFIMPRPKSLPKKVQHHTKKPDTDNLCKAVKDALRGICYRDDSQIVELVATKEYGIKTGVSISILEVDVEEYLIQHGIERNRRLL